MRKAQGELELRYGQEWQSKVTTYESRILKSNQDLEGVEIRLKQTLFENEELRRRILELSDVNRRVSEYENRITLMAQ